MMLFKPEHVTPILEGRKTQTRRLWKTPRVKVGGIYKAKTRMLSKEYFARLCVLKLRQETLYAITDADARAEGYANAGEYIRAFYRINGFEPTNPKVYVIEFELIKEGGRT